jgi:hypothetical protein
MAFDREAAKNSIVARDTEDSELQQTLTAAHQFQLELTKEQNRHTEAMRGWHGRLLGSNESAPSMIAFIGMILGLVVAVVCLYVANSQQPSNMAFWGQWAERALGFAASCVAYIFGKGLKS